jgi:3-oxoacyl-[acyl-carrier protein] reductase
MTTEKKTALVTGASGTLGSAMAQALAAAGWRVAVHYHHGRDAASQAVENILAAGGEALAVAADLSSQQDAAALFQQIEERLGPVDCLVNNAGISRDVLLAFMSEEQWDEVIDTNLRATYVCSRLAVMGMMRSGAGSICNIVSPSGVRGQAGQCNYAASKGGMIAFTKAPHVGQVHREGRAAVAGRDSPGALWQAGGDRSPDRLSGLGAGKLHHGAGHCGRWRTDLTPSSKVFLFTMNDLSFSSAPHCSGKARGAIMRKTSKQLPKCSKYPDS